MPESTTATALRNGASRARIRVRIVYQMDPLGLVAGGVPTFIKGIIKAAPPDIELSLVGLTADHRTRPVGRWSTVPLDGVPVAFFPVGRDRNPGGRSAVPLSMKMSIGVSRYLRACSADCDVLEFHRFEPAIPLFADPRPKTAFIHQNMDAVRNAKSDIRWKHWPALYFALERLIVPRFASVFCVRADAVAKYRAEYPSIADRFHFVSTWMDPAVFYPMGLAIRKALRRRFDEALRLLPGDDVLLYVGRLDQQKDPLLLVESFAKVHEARPSARLLVVGDGVLRSAMAARAGALGLGTRVVFLGLLSSTAVAELLQIADAFLLTSAYEGMPMAVLEALGCGVPVVTTDVGEVRRVVHHGVNGQIVEQHAAEAFGLAVLEVLNKREAYRGRPCTDAVLGYTPERVLAPVYENYRRIVGGRTLPADSADLPEMS